MGDKQFLGEMAPLVRIFDDRGRRTGMLSRDPPPRTRSDGGCSPSVPLPSECPPRYTTVSQENSDEEALVEVPVPVKSELDCPDPLADPVLLDLEEPPLLLPLFCFLLFIRCNRDAS